jgi:hypothetical protein
MGIDERNGRLLKEIYFCQDICPDYETVFLVYDGINSSSNCDSIGGKTMLTGIPSPGHFIGCVPKVD